MAELNPLLKAYPSLPSPCSKRSMCIAGIRTTIYGLDESAASDEVACLWLLHPRLQSQECMEPIATSALHAWNNRPMIKDERERCGLIAVTFDQRNHGSRQIDATANEDWRSGNQTHAQDMFGIYQGTAVDTSQLIDYLPAYLFPQGSRRLKTNLVCGVSLGGHAAWQCLFQEPRISAAISIIGCPDFTRLMYDRARLSRLDSFMDGTFLGSRNFPQTLIRAIEKHDPTAMIFDRSGFSQGNDFDTLQKFVDNATLISRLTSKINGKKMLNMSGSEDKLVPYRCSQPFLQWLSSWAINGQSQEDEPFILKDKMYEGVGHSMSEAMASDLNDFILENLTARLTTEAPLASRM